ncbi:hypothetical protein AGMMS49992_11990 [Clostridia bacterium]|nr:hypothetical protein AGMMS49992_11990 [Clostridia bacterium]
MSVHAAIVYGEVGSASLYLPNIITPPEVFVQCAVYSSVRYVEYMLVQSTPDAGVLLSVGTQYTGAGRYMIAPGAKGASGTSSKGGDGGAGGTESYSTSFTLPVGTYKWTVTKLKTRFEQTSGSGFTAVELLNTGTAKATGTPYRLYGNATYPIGTITAKTAGAAYVPGKGASGSDLCSVRAQDTMYAASSTTYGFLEGAYGCGAGGNGGSRTGLQTTAFSGYDLSGGYGAPGAILLRIPW